jgi:hypothetical protein
MQESQLTNVMFYKHKPSKEIFAIFTDNRYPFDANMFEGYAHIGQHSLYHKVYIKESIPARLDEYQNLLIELIDLIGYKLNVLN